AIPVVAGRLALLLLAVLLPSPLVKMSASRTRMNTAPAIHPQGVGAPILRSMSIRRSISMRGSKSRGSVIATSLVIAWTDNPGRGRGVPLLRNPRKTKAKLRRLRRTEPGLLVLLSEDQLRLRDDRGELAVAAGDAGLEHDRGATAVQRHADRPRGIALRHGGKEIGLALDGRGAPAIGQAAHRSHSAERVAQSHDRSAVQHAAPVAQLLAPNELGLAPLG